MNERAVVKHLLHEISIRDEKNYGDSESFTQLQSVLKNFENKSRNKSMKRNCPDFRLALNGLKTSGNERAT